MYVINSHRTAQIIYTAYNNSLSVVHTSAVHEPQVGGLAARLLKTYFLKKNFDLPTILLHVHHVLHVLHVLHVHVYYGKRILSNVTSYFTKKDFNTFLSFQNQKFSFKFPKLKILETSIFRFSNYVNH